MKQKTNTSFILALSIAAALIACKPKAQQHRDASAIGCDCYTW